VYPVGRFDHLDHPSVRHYAADIKSETAIPSRCNTSPNRMKKYLPSMDELVSGVVVIIVGFTVWSLVQPMISKLTAKLTPSAAA
jgi:hypothetical protein